MEHVLPFIMHHWLLCLALLVVLILIIVLEQGSFPGGVKMIMPQAAVNLMNRNQAVVIDIRDAKQYRNGHIIDAVNLSAEEIKNKPQRIEKFKTKAVIIVCANGQESAKIAAQLKKQGFEKIVVLKEGMRAWETAELPLIKK